MRQFFCQDHDLATLSGPAFQGEKLGVVSPSRVNAPAVRAGQATMIVVIGLEEDDPTVERDRVEDNCEPGPGLMRIGAADA